MLHPFENAVTDDNEESFFVRQAYFLGANDPYKSLKTTLKAQINQEAWEALHNDMSRPFTNPEFDEWLGERMLPLHGRSLARRSKHF